MLPTERMEWVPFRRMGPMKNEVGGFVQEGQWGEVRGRLGAEAYSDALLWPQFRDHLAAISTKYEHLLKHRKALARGATRLPRI